MATEENIAAVRRFWEGFNTHNLNIWDEVCTPDFNNHDPSLPTPHADLPTTKQTVAALFFPALPDVTATEEDLIATGDKVVVRSRLTGRKIAEQWVVFDALGLLQQIGGVPGPGQGAREACNSDA